MSSSSMTEEEMVGSLMRDYSVPREKAIAMVRASGLTELNTGHADEIRRAVESPSPSLEEMRCGHRRSTVSAGVTEADMQIELLARLVGPAVKGQPRAAGVGLAATYPELGLVYAINPNKGGRKAAAAGIAKAMGLLADMPDLHLPVMRGPFLSLYVELKRPGEKMRPPQRLMAMKLREQGHCVLEFDDVDDAVNAFVGYLELPPNRPAARAVSGKNAPFRGTLAERITQWRAQLYDLLQSARRKAHG